MCVCVCVWGGGVGCWCKSRRGYTFYAIENEGLYKILQPFLKGHVFCCIAISILQKITKEESIICQILFFIKMMAYQTNITWC